MTKGESENKMKMFFIPAIIGISHIAPMVKAARLFASHPNVQVTIISTFQTSQTFQTAIHTDRASGHDIGFHIVKIPIFEVGLHDEDLENILTSSSPDVGKAVKLMKAVGMLSSPILNLVRDQLADCMVVDFLHPWAADVAFEANIPLIMFSASGLFHTCCEDSLDRFKPHENVVSDWEPFVLPGLPDHVELTRSRLPDHFRGELIIGKEFISSLKHALDKCYCLMVNSFCELESKYVHYYNNVVGRKCCLVGPLHCYPAPKDYNSGKTTVDNDNNNSSSSSSNIFEWLDTKTSNSVLYVSFGSYAPMCKEQFHEIAHGLEASGHPFIWVARQNWSGNQDDEAWFPEGFEARVRDLDQGLVLKTWAPQELILGHPNVGAFMTHCGWNSCQESLSNGVPVITWPLMVEQFYNECFMVDVLQVGIQVGNEEWASYHGLRKVTVTRNKVDEAVRRMMNDHAEEMRKQVQPFVDKCKEAVQKSGSSYQNVCDLVKELNNRKQQSTAMV